MTEDQKQKMARAMPDANAYLSSTSEPKAMSNKANEGECPPQSKTTMALIPGAPSAVHSLDVGPIREWSSENPVSENFGLPFEDRGVDPGPLS